MRVVLTGFMGTGKTAVGQRVAERLGRQFLDTDALVERRAGKSVREIFATVGEDAFRALERDAVAEACRSVDTVVAIGGGALVDESNFARLADSSFLVCLTATPSAISRRVRATAALRPLLRGRSGLTARIRELLAERAPVYARVRYVVDTTDRTIEQVADEVIGGLRVAEGTPVTPRRDGSTDAGRSRRSTRRAAAK
jgi:shikimate kinase